MSLSGVKQAHHVQFSTQYSINYQLRSMPSRCFDFQRHKTGGCFRRLLCGDDAAFSGNSCNSLPVYACCASNTREDQHILEHGLPED